MKARKRFGQHFLEPAWVTKLIDAVAPQADDTFFEIGPGRGALTIPLAPRVKRLIAIEVDRDLAAALPSHLPDHAEIIEGDVLELDLDTLLATIGTPVRVVGNLPYNISSPILFMLLRAAREGAAITDATLMLQKEVADRLVARPGESEYGVLAIQVARVATVNRPLVLPPGAFRPPPLVTSAVVRLTFTPASVDVGDPSTFEQLVRGVFQQRRKTVVNALKPFAESVGRSAQDLVDAAAIDPAKRPEVLTVEEFARLSRAVL